MNIASLQTDGDVFNLPSVVFWREQSDSHIPIIFTGNVYVSYFTN